MREAEEMKGCLLICTLTGELKLISDKCVCVSVAVMLGSVYTSRWVQGCACLYDLIECV